MGAVGLDWEERIPESVFKILEPEAYASQQLSRQSNSMPMKPEFDEFTKLHERDFVQEELAEYAESMADWEGQNLAPVFRDYERGNWFGRSFDDPQDLLFDDEWRRAEDMRLALVDAGVDYVRHPGASVGKTRFKDDPVDYYNYVITNEDILNNPTRLFGERVGNMPSFDPLDDPLVTRRLKREFGEPPSRLDPNRLPMIDPMEGMLPPNVDPHLMSLATRMGARLQDDERQGLMSRF